MSATLVRRATATYKRVYALGDVLDMSGISGFSYSNLRAVLKHDAKIEAWLFSTLLNGHEPDEYAFEIANDGYHLTLSWEFTHDSKQVRLEFDHDPVVI